MDYFNHGWGMGFGWLIPLLFLGMIFYLLQNKTKEKRSSAQDILDKRYANGGMDEEEYKEKSRHLSEHE